MCTKSRADALNDKFTSRLRAKSSRTIQLTLKLEMGLACASEELEAESANDSPWRRLRNELLRDAPSSSPSSDRSFK